MTETGTTLREGQQMLGFELPDHEGQAFDLYGKLQETPLVLVFYRGDW